MRLKSTPPDYSPRHDTTEVSSSTVRAFAEAVMKPGSNVGLYRQDGSNELDRWVTLSEALFFGRPFFVTVRDEVLGVDGDSPEQAEAVRLLFMEMGLAGREPVLLASGQQGRYHLVARLGATKPMWEKRAKVLGLDVRRTIRSPLAPHRLGGRSVLVEPTDPFQAYRALAHGSWKKLKSEHAKLLKEGVPKGARSNAIASMALSAVNRDWTFAMFREALTDPANGLSERYLEKAEGEQDRLLELDWQKAVSHYLAHPPIEGSSDVLEALDALRRLISSAQFPGRTGSRDRKVLHVIIDTGMKAATLSPSVSMRQGAEAAGMSAKTFSNGISSLIQGEWIRMQNKGNKNLGLAATYGFVIPPPASLPTQSEEESSSKAGLTSPYSENFPTCISTSSLPSYVVARGGCVTSGDLLGIDGFFNSGKGFEIWEALTSTPSTPKGIAERAGASVSTVYSWLRIFEGEFAVKRDGGWVQRLGDPAVLAERRGTSGKQAAMKARHAKDRAKLADKWKKNRETEEP